MAIELKLDEVSKITGLPPNVLQDMRTRLTNTFKSGPPFCKTMDPLGNTKYVYKKQEVMRWLRRTHCQVTALDAALILGVSRADLLARYNQGTHSWKGPSGDLVINVGRNLFIWRPKIPLEKGRFKKVGG